MGPLKRTRRLGRCGRGAPGFLPTPAPGETMTLLSTSAEHVCRAFHPSSPRGQHCNQRIKSDSSVSGSLSETLSFTLGDLRTGGLALAAFRAVIRPKAAADLSTWHPAGTALRTSPGPGVIFLGEKQKSQGSCMRSSTKIAALSMAPLLDTHVPCSKGYKSDFTV